MKQKICRFIFTRVLGWKYKIDTPVFKKCVICVAPHTSNWDLFIGQLYYGMLGLKASFMMKKEWFFFPLGSLFKAIGGIPVHRSKKTSLVDQMTEKFNERETFHLAITPEATRKPNKHWRKGFYFIAKQANVPILLIGVDYPSKMIHSGHYLYPTGNLEQDMEVINNFFKNFTGKNPKNFLLDESTASR